MTTQTETKPRSTSESLAMALADTYILYLKTQNYHWNVTGPQFHSLHSLFETQYNELALANDEIAEQIRTFGVRAPASFAEYSKLTQIKENQSKITATEMVKDLYQDNLAIANSIKPQIETSDSSTADLLTRRVQAHEKAGWMLKATLE